MNQRHNRIATFLFALVILLFTGGPVLLSLIGSLVPDRVLLDSRIGLFDEGINFQNYRYVFTGQLPDAYLTADANRAMISDAARQIPRSLWNSTVIALSSMALNLLLDRARGDTRAAARDTAWREISRASVGGEDVADDPPADEAVSSAQRLRQLIDAVDDLAPQMGRAFRLHKLEGLSHAQTAQVMGLSVKAVEKHVSAALKALTRRLAP